MSRLFLLAAAFASLAGAVSAGGLVATEVAPDIFALTGPLTNRDADNLGNNATFGLVVTDAGAVLIDAGANARAAAALDEAIAMLTDQPVVTVINTGGQDHRWLGNGYWQEKDARIVASEAAVADQQERAGLQMTVLSTLAGPQAIAGTTPVFADTVFAESYAFDLGGVHFDLTHAPAHTPGDSFVWLPGAGVVFTGDLVFTERMLGVLGESSSRDWLASFEAMAARAPAIVVPGHGGPTDLATATRDTYDYLAFLRGEIGALIEAGGEILDIGRIDQSGFDYLVNSELLAGRNAQAVFIEMEWE